MTKAGPRLEAKETGCERRRPDFKPQADSQSALRLVVTCGVSLLGCQTEGLLRPAVLTPAFWPLSAGCGEGDSGAGGSHDTPSASTETSPCSPHATHTSSKNALFSGFNSYFGEL